MVMRRWLRLTIAAIAVAAILAACGDDEEETGTASPAATPVRTGTPVATATPQATATVTALPSTPTPTVVAETPTAEAPAPTPEPTEEIRQPVWTVSQVSKEAAVEIILDDGLGHTYTVASVDPEVVQWENWGVQFAADLDADGVGDVLVFHFTGGAHCCFEYLAFRETSAGIELDHWFSLGNGGIGGVEDLDGDGVPELEGFDDRLAYFTDLSYAASPSLPIVLCRTGDGTYTDCTILFPDRMQEAADGFEAALSDAVQRQASDEEKRSAALGLVTAYLLLAPTDEGWLKVRSLCPECETWLLQNQAELENRLAYVPPAPPMEPLPQ
jgi:hypothetical protein